MRIVAAATAAPVIGLPTVAPDEFLCYGRRVVIGQQEALQRWPKLHGRSCTVVILDEWAEVPPTGFTMFQGHKFYYNERLPS